MRNAPAFCMHIHIYIMYITHLNDKDHTSAFGMTYSDNVSHNSIMKIATVFFYSGSQPQSWVSEPRHYVCTSVFSFYIDVVLTLSMWINDDLFLIAGTNFCDTLCIISTCTFKVHFKMSYGKCWSLLLWLQCVDRMSCIYAMLFEKFYEGCLFQL